MVRLDLPIQVKASLVILSAQLCFSGWHIVGSLAFKGGTNPIVFILYRLLIGTSLMHLYIKVNKLNTFIEEEDYKRMFVCGFLSIFQIMSGSLALTVIAPSRFAIFQPSIPCVVAAISMFFRLEKMSPTKMFGIALAVTGAFVAELWRVSGSESNAEESNVPLGVCLSIMQVVGMAALMVAVKPLLNKYHPAVVSGMYFVVSTAFIILVVVCRIDMISLSDFAFEGKLLPWLAIWYVAVFATMYSFSAINWGGKYLPPTVTTVFFTFQPVGTIILSATLLGAVVTIPEIVGGLLIVAGLVVTSVAQSRSSGGGSGSSGSGIVELTDEQIVVQGLQTVAHESGTFVELTPNSTAFNPLQGSQYVPVASSGGESCMAHSTGSPCTTSERVRGTLARAYIYDDDVYEEPEVPLFEV